MERIVATRSSWKAEPFDAEVDIPYSASFSAEDFDTIRQGLVPAQMEDKWFIFFESNVLHIHRSWTGAGTFKVEFRSDAEGAHVVAAKSVSGSISKDTVVSANLLGFLIDRILLGRDVELPDLTSR